MGRRHVFEVEEAHVVRRGIDLTGEKMGIGRNLEAVRLEPMPRRVALAILGRDLLALVGIGAVATLGGLPGEAMPDAVHLLRLREALLGLDGAPGRAPASTPACPPS